MPGFPTVRSFLSARDAWWAARKAAPVGSTRGRTPTLGGAALKEGRWKMSGRAYMRAYTSLSGDLVRYPAELTEIIADHIEAMAPRLAAAFDRRLGRLAWDAWSRWPVDTGLSRSLLDVELSQQGDIFRGAIVSRAPYTVFIKTRAGSAYQELLRKPGRAVAAQILDDLVEGDRAS